MLDTIFGRDKDGPAASAPTSLPKWQVPLDPLIPEWDLLVEIRYALRKLPLVKLVYVKGHQDAHKAYNRLSLRAQLNVDADDLAGKYQQDYGKAHPFALMTPRTGGFLIYPEGTKTSRYAQDIRHRATTEPLREYIREKYGFSEMIMSTINWKAHGKALKAMIKKRIHITKLVHECLPTMERLNKFDGSKKMCPGCAVCVETRDHILKCKATGRRQWREKFFQAINEFHAKEDTSPLLRNLWNEAVGDWMTSDDEIEFQASPILFHNDVRAVIFHQNTIGWRQIINGRFSVEWSRIQDDYYARKRYQSGKNDRRRGQQWQIKLIRLIWKEWMNLWKMRNEDLHGRDTETRAITERREVEQALREVYERRNHFEPRVQELLLREEHEHMQRPIWVTRNWLTVNGPIFRESARRAKANAIAGVRSIRSYFAPAR